MVTEFSKPALFLTPGQLKPMKFYQIVAGADLSSDDWQIGDLMYTSDYYYYGSNNERTLDIINPRTKTKVSQEYNDYRYREIKEGESFTVTV
jgi:hypothetical protein